MVQLTLSTPEVSGAARQKQIEHIIISDALYWMQRDSPQ